MTERDYFSLRYLAPGFGFILTVVGLNYLPVLQILNVSGFGTVDNGIGILVSLISLLASSAIGFLISQFWFFRYNYCRKEELIFEPLVETIEKEMKCTLLQKEAKKKRWPFSSQKEKDRVQELSSLLDFVILSHEEEWKFCQRKFDLHVLLGCTLFSLGIGYFVGLLTRLITIVGFKLIEPIKLLSAFPSLAQIDCLLYWFTMTIVILLVLVLYISSGLIFREYYPMMRIIIKKRVHEKGFPTLIELKESLPKLFEASEPSKKIEERNIAYV
jgi:hypothetical protein